MNIDEKIKTATELERKLWTELMAFQESMKPLETQLAELTKKWCAAQDRMRLLVIAKTEMDEQAKSEAQ